MRIVLLFTTVLVIMYSCRIKTMRAPTASMDETIKEGQVFTVVQTKTFKRNDVAVFDYFGEDYGSAPDENGKYKLANKKRVYRIVAMSSDIVELKSGEVYVNGILNPLAETGKLEYVVFSRVPIDEFEKNYMVYPLQKSGDSLKYQVCLSKKQIRELSQRPEILAIKKHFENIPFNDSSFARERNFINWTVDDYGPLKIPSPGDSIMVDDLNFQLYHNIPGIHKGMSLIKEKLYFLMGDNRHRSQDSRFIGLISHSKMFGVVQ